MSAVLSPDGMYRYRLDRVIEKRPGRRAVFVMLNPSTADAENDDPTIRRCIGFAKRWDCVQVTVVNLFAFRATKPRDLFRAAEPVGRFNDDYLRMAAGEAVHNGGVVCCAWGVAKRAKARAAAVYHLLILAQCNPCCLDYNEDGTPKHPLYVKKDAGLNQFIVSVR